MSDGGCLVERSSKWLCGVYEREKGARVFFHSIYISAYYSLISTYHDIEDMIDNQRQVIRGTRGDSQEARYGDPLQFESGRRQTLCPEARSK